MAASLAEPSATPSNSPATWPPAPPPRSSASAPATATKHSTTSASASSANPSTSAPAALRAADVVHCHQRHIVISSMSALLARLTRKRVFVSDLGGGGWDISRYISTENWYHGHLHISRYSRQVSNQAECPRAHVIMGGVDTARFSPDPAIPRTQTIV